MNTGNRCNRIGKLARPLALAALFVNGAPLAAHETDPVYTMTVIVDAAHGGKVAAGKYDRAIEKITARKSGRNAYSRQTNLCVAYTKTGALEKATEACEEALAIVLDGADTRGVLAGTTQSAKVGRRYLALALSNLGVLHAAKGSTDMARKNFREALALDSGLSAPKVNLARLARDKNPNA
jgi:tetratricopeptide (TPR) repeat protein